MAAYEDLDCSAKESSKRDRTNAFKGGPPRLNCAATTVDRIFRVNPTISQQQGRKQGGRSVKCNCVVKRSV